MKQNIIDRVEGLKPHTIDSISSIQYGKVPSYIDLNPRKEFYYLYNSMYTPINTNRYNLIEVTGLRYKSLFKRRNNMTFTVPLLDMINNNEIHPFMLFVNGLFVKWSDITIINELNKQYLLIETPDMIIESIHIINIPFNVLYSETGVTNGNEVLYSFDDDGTYSTDGLIKFSVDNPNLIVNNIVAYTGLMLFEALEPEYKLTTHNIIVFKDGKLYPEANIKVDPMNLLTIDNGNDINISCTLVFDTRPSIPKNNLLQFKNKEKITSLVKDYLSGDNTSAFMDKLIQEFNFKYSSDTYSTNVENALLYIMLYNSKLMNKIYKDKSNIVSVTHIGAEIKALTDGNSILTLPRRRSGIYDDNVMIFVNGRIYDYHYMITYTNNKFSIPISDISDDDTVELLFFKNCYNRVAQVKLTLGEEYTLIDEDLNLTNLKLFSREVSNPEYTLDPSIYDMAYYPVEYTLSYTTDNKPKITPTDPFYYGKTLYAISDNQFRYVGYRIQDESINKDLTRDFSLCHNEERYMVFVDGVKLNKEHYRIVMPSATTPIYNIAIYSNVVFHTGSRVDVFYLPFDYEELIATPDQDIIGDITIDKSKISYNFDKDLYLIFSNGVKINNKDIVNKDDDTLYVIKNADKLDNLCIVKYIESESDMEDLFGQSSTLDDIINSMGNEEFMELMNIITSVIPDDDTILAQLISNPTVSVISSNNQNIARAYGAGIGEYNDAIAVGGITSTTINFSNSVEKYHNIAGWSSITNINIGRNKFAGVGVPNSGLIFGGNVATSTPPTESYNGVAWTTSDGLLENKANNSGAGSRYAAISTGGLVGNNPVYTGESYNGTTWSTIQNMSVVRAGHSMAGTSYDALAIGGNYASNTVEKYNGYSWSTIDGAGLNLNRTYHTGAGYLVDTSIIAGGVSNEGSTQDTVEVYENEAFSMAGNLNTARVGLMGCGTVEDAVFFGGYVNSNVLSNITEVYSRTVNIVADKTVIEKIIRDYWLKPITVTTGDVFVYDYEHPDEVDKFDDAGNLILNVMDSNETDNIL